MPTFVHRDISPELVDWMRGARRTGGFLVLVGNSSVGKTRLLFETAREVLPDFALLAPDLGDGELVKTVASAPLRESKGLVVWLDELQRFLPGPYFVESAGEGHVPITSTAIRQLLEAKTPVIIVGTLWPEFDVKLRGISGTASGEVSSPRYQQAVDILEQVSRTFFVDTFSESERAAAIELAARDPRLAQAVVNRDFNVTETLAGAREIMRRYQQAPETHKAIVHAASDARRLGVLSPIPRDLLFDMARGYWTGIQARPDWFDDALAELCNRSRRQDRATAPVIEIPNADRTEVRGFTLADYLLQHLSRARRYQLVPELAWRALMKHTDDFNDLRRLASSAANRLYYSEAESIYRALVARADRVALARLGNLLTRRRRASEAIDLLSEHLASGDRHIVPQLASLLARMGRIDELRELAETGDSRASQLLVDVLVKNRDPTALAAIAASGRAYASRKALKRASIEQVRSLAAMGYEPAVRRLVDQLTRDGQTDELRSLANSGARVAQRELASILCREGRLAELRIRAGQGDRYASLASTVLLARRGDIAGLREMADAGEYGGVLGLANFYSDRGQLGDSITVLRKYLAAGDNAAIVARLAKALVANGQPAAAIELLEQHPTAAKAHLAILLVDANRTREAVEVMRKRPGVGGQQAAHRLATALWRSGRRGPAMSLLRDLAQRGDGGAADRLAKFLAEDGQTDELRARAASGDRHAVRMCARIAADDGRIADAIALLRGAIDAGDDGACILLARLLATRGDVDALMKEVDAGMPGASGYLLDALNRRGDSERASRLRTEGLTPPA
ncbi:hypothetical protein [Kribbella sp. NPDC049227]|uniref:tetratricopeptide repeat protein n=1 Tax=Kribbella sp. NPDC049227 TaxID=3364113 RepID=UPI00371BA7CA